MLNVRRNVVFSVGELLANLVLVLVTYRIVVRVGGVDMLGLWSTLFAWLALARLGDLGVGGAVTRFVSQLDVATDGPRIRDYLHTAFVSSMAIYTALMLVAGIAGYAVLPRIVGPAYEAQAEAVFPYMLASLVAGNLASVTLSALIALHFGYQRSVLTVAGNVIQLVLAALLVPKFGLIGLAVAQIVQFVLTAIVAWLLVSRILGKLEWPVRLRLDVLREVLAFSLSFQTAAALNSAFEPLSKLLVGSVGGMHAQGLYEAAYKTVYLSRNVAVQAATATLPALTRLLNADRPEAQKLYRRTRRNLWGGLLAIAGSLVVVAPVVSLFWFGALQPLYLSFVAVLAVGAVANGASAVAYNIGTALGQLRANIVIIALSLAFMVAVGSLAGIWGGVVAIVAVVAAASVASAVAIIILNERLLARMEIVD